MLGNTSAGDLPFFKMGQTDDVSKKYLPHINNSTSVRIIIPTGCPFGNNVAFSAHVRYVEKRVYYYVSLHFFHNNVKWHINLFN